MSAAAVTGAASSPGLREVELSIRGMTCAACAARVEKKLGALGDVAATANLATEKATVVAPPAVPVERLIEAVEEAGYEAELTGPAGAGRSWGSSSRATSRWRPRAAWTPCCWTRPGR
jgi:copper chaperone CopZ